MWQDLQHGASTVAPTVGEDSAGGCSNQTTGEEAAGGSYESKGRARGALPQETRAKAVVDFTRAAPVRDVVIDMCAGRQSMKGPARKQGNRYVAVEIDAAT